MRVLDSEFADLSLCANPAILIATFSDAQLDRILQAYRLPLDLRSVHTSTNPRESLSSSRVRQGKLNILLEFLGAARILEHDRLKRGMY